MRNWFTSLVRAIRLPKDWNSVSDVLAHPEVKTAIAKAEADLQTKALTALITALAKHGG